MHDMYDMHACTPDWLELAPISDTAPRRLFVFLHGAGSSPGQLIGFAHSWQLKFPGARALLLQAPAASSHPGGFDWFDSSGTAMDRRARIEAAAAGASQRITALQLQHGINSRHTVLIGFSQGATVALQLARSDPQRAAIVVSYAGQLARPIGPGEQVDATIHLIHGELDTWVPAVHAQRAHDGLRAIGADVTLDLDEQGTHRLDRAMVMLGTRRLMQTLFRGRQRPAGRAPRILH